MNGGSGTLDGMIIPEGYAQVNLVFTGAALPRGAEITFGVDNGGELAASTIASKAAQAWQNAGMDDRQTNQVSMTLVKVKKGPNDTGAYAELGVAIPGTQAAETVTPNTAALFKKVTDFGGRQGRGRFYLPGYPETGVSGAGVIAGAGVTANQTAATALLTQLSLEGIPMVLLHGAALNTPDPVTSLVAQAQVATQRRRNRA